MKTALLKRLKRLEEVRAVASQSPVEFQIGYVKRLPQEYPGERHIVTVGRAADGKYRWEERRGAPPANEDGPTSIIRLFLARAKDGQRTIPGRRMRTHEMALFLMPERSGARAPPPMTAPELNLHCYRYVDLSFASVGQPVMYATAEDGRKSPCDGLNATELDRYLRAGG